MTSNLLHEMGEDSSTRHREEASNKNPIRIRLRRDHLMLPMDRITETIALGRDFFHTFISATIGRHYQRPPIYLVDGWLTTALGVFVAGRFPPPAEARTGQQQTPADSSWHTRAIRGLGPTILLFDRLHDVQELLNGVRILSLSGISVQLEETCEKLVESNAVPDESAKLADQLVKLADQLSDLVAGAGACLERDLFLQPRLDKSFIAAVGRTLSRLKEAILSFMKAPLPEVFGGTFGGGRPSGVLYGSIPELDIEGPAIIIAPRHVQKWAKEWEQSSAPVMNVPRGSMDYWFGVGEPQHRLFAVALQNVLQHEITHAMVSLATDVVEDRKELFIAQRKFYTLNKGFEEGLSNATAAVLTGVTLQKAMFDIKGKFLPKLHQGRYAEDWDRQLLPWLRHTYEGYYDSETDTFINAWNSHKRDYGAFAGLLKIYSTNFTGFNWAQTQEAFQKGVILTSR